MDDKLLRFFDQMPEALPLYQKFEREVLSRVEDVRIKVQKTQITYSNRHVFACVSFAKVRKAKERPPVYIVVTFGLAYKKRVSPHRHCDRALPKPVDPPCPRIP